MGDVAVDVADAPVEEKDLALVDRLWRSGTSATAVSPSTREDLELLQRFLTAADRTTVVPLLRRHRVATWRLAAAVTMDLGRAAEAVEAAWREVLDGDRAPVSTWENPRAWLFEITRRHALSLGAAPGMALDHNAGISEVPFDQTGDHGLLAASFALLDEPARTAVWLHTVEGFDDVDAALVLGRNRLETHDLIDDAMAELRVSAVRAQIQSADERCTPGLRRFLGYLDEALDPADEQDLLVHLSRCRRCAARMDALEAPGLSLVDRVIDPPSPLTDLLRQLARVTPDGDAPDAQVG